MTTSELPTLTAGRREYLLYSPTAIDRRIRRLIKD